MNPNRKNRREWFIFTVVLIIGIFLLQFAASIASSEPDQWRVMANLESSLNPDHEYSIKLFSELAPVKPDIMTPPAWNIKELLTPEPVETQKEAIIPIANFHQTPTPTLGKAPVVAQPIVNTQNPPKGKTNNEPAPSINSPTPTVENAVAGNPVGSPTSSILTNSTSTPTPYSQPPTSTVTLTQPPVPIATLTPTNPTPTAPALQPTKKPKPTRKPKPTKRNPQL